MHRTQGVPLQETPQDFASRVGLRFNNLLLLERALTHSSYLNEHPEAIEDNERLEFLGDAVLDFLVGAWLYHHFPELREGDLTRLRAALVKTEQLAEFAQEIKLGQALQLGKGERSTGGRNRQALLCGAFEALIGALYLDGGLGVVEQFIEPFIQPTVEKILASRGDKDPKSELQEFVQSRGFPPPYYRTISTTGPEHEKTFEVEVLLGDISLSHGVGKNKHLAEKDAAQQALELIKKLGL